MTRWLHDPFFQYPQLPSATSEGEVALPILYFDCSNFVALFEVDYAAADALVRSEGLEAVRYPGGRALVALALYEYRHTAIGAYNEVGVAIAALPAGAPQPRSAHLSLLQPQDTRHAGMHVIDLPVTTAAACAAGRELWGYPKFVTPIEFALSDGAFRGAVADPDSEMSLMSIAGSFGPGVPAPQLDLVLYSRLDGALLRTLVNTRGGGRAHLPGSMRLEVSEAAHPMAGRLRQLGLSRARPRLVFESQRLQLRLNAGARIPERG